MNFAIELSVAFALLTAGAVIGGAISYKRLSASGQGAYAGLLLMLAAASFVWGVIGIIWQGLK